MRIVQNESVETDNEIRKICDDMMVQDILKRYPYNLNPLRHRMVCILISKKHIRILRAILLTYSWIKKL
ncbi:hypothetical protein SDC9_212460 [bioreactor metagenome]|uniref:Uncharacterized protein n=1 Tax=bioreactor metagenome TaxID=1076179 RepID=A0A645JZ28_9ZZZZ